MSWDQNVFNEDLLVEDPLDPSPALIAPSPAHIIPLSVNILLNRLAPSVTSNILRNPPRCFLDSFLIVSLTPVNDIPESSRDLTIFKMYSNSSLEITRVLL